MFARWLKQKHVIPGLCICYVFCPNFQKCSFIEMTFKSSKKNFISLKTEVLLLPSQKEKSIIVTVSSVELREPAKTEEWGKIASALQLYCDWNKEEIVWYENGFKNMGEHTECILSRCTPGIITESSQSVITEPPSQSFLPCSGDGGRPLRSTTCPFSNAAITASNLCTKKYQKFRLWQT